MLQHDKVFRFGMLFVVCCSYEQLVSEHRIDPEQVLLNLGFVKPSNSDTLQIPDHFLLYQSQARGITLDDYLQDHPDVRQRLEQKQVLENAFRAVNRTPPSPAASVPPADENGQGQSLDLVDRLIGKLSDFVGHLEDRSLEFTDLQARVEDKKETKSNGNIGGETAGFECCSSGFQGHLKNKFPNCIGHLKGQTESFNLAELDGCVSGKNDGHIGNDFAAFEGVYQGRFPGFQGHLKGTYSRYAISMLTSLFADERLPLRYLDSLMRRLRNGRDPNQAALIFDEFGLGWSWKLDSESLSSCWLPSSDLESLDLPEKDSVPMDDWSMQQPTAGDWSALNPPISSHWLVQPPSSCDWSVQWPTTETDQSASFLSMLPAMRRPLSTLLPTTVDSCFLEFADQSRNLADERNPAFRSRGGIFCDCCDQHSEQDLPQGAAIARTSWDRLEIVDFYIDDGTELIETSHCPPSQLRQKCDEEFDPAETLV